MRIIVSGCSMATGYECTRLGEQNSEDWQLAWPAALGRQLKATVHNVSAVGVDNDTIWRNAQNELFKTGVEDTLVVIGWTEHSRECYVDPTGVYFLNAWFGLAGYKDPRTPESVRLAYRAWLARDIDGWLNAQAWRAWSAHVILQAQGVPHVFFNAVGALAGVTSDKLLHSNLRQPSTDIWNSIEHDGYYISPTDQTQTQLGWLRANWPNDQVSLTSPRDRRENHLHWNQHALKGWAEHLVPYITAVKKPT